MVFKKSSAKHSFQVTTALHSSIKIQHAETIKPNTIP